ncbi:4-hydroxythreonine-4-phosphate dehydrogenase PdxA [Hyphomonas johnsonii]|uniref:4-hydroxythreonine-4-phosphate dehydrogenase n=1 Tax=Hyphomonas johnsonii MHS-2 TaxID=1280950 RepID=A0A059FTL7_9PROT|nr:4-hydroxythreonine-4-phosphate dehydrogenase PdxA [Hyphomonas johnsonii]KCZ94004.1 4-hydroxythreonine-4-phosphate dehydrogenase [Hyphomonas johnsonii MHS-2]
MTHLPPLPLALTMGDPAGCGPAITAAAWHQLRAEPGLAFYVIGAPALYAGMAPVREISAPSDALGVFAEALPVLPLADVPAVQPGQPDASAAPAIIRAIALATSHALAHQAGGLVTNPINKALLYGTGFAYPGHTEYVAHLCAAPGAPAPRPVMMLVGGGLRVALATIHIRLADVPGALDTAALVALGEIVAAALTRDFGLATPRIAFSGLNPHAGENGTIGDEEVRIINPAAHLLRQKGIDMSDARPGDTVFAEALAGAYDAVIAMTHDQGLIPVKTLDLWGGVNVTLGLPVVRTSPDHGTAYDAAAAGTARPDSLIAAIRLAAAMADARRATP